MSLRFRSVGSGLVASVVRSVEICFGALSIDVNGQSLLVEQSLTKELKAESKPIACARLCCAILAFGSIAPSKINLPTWLGNSWA